MDRAKHAEQHAAGDTAPGARASPRLAFEGLLAVDLTLAQRAEREARALGGAPPARAEQGKAPEDGFVFIQPNDLATVRLVLEGGQFKSPIRQGSGGGIEATGRAIVAYLFVFNAPRTLSRPRGTPVSRAKTVANSRQLHGEEREPCSRGS